MRSAESAIVSFLILSLLIASSPCLSAFLPVQADLNSGPLINSILYRVIAGQDQRVLAMQAGEIEMDTNYFDPVYYDALDNDPDIDVFGAPRNGYGHITINCRDAPLNESVLRRAFAFAFDKERVSAEVLNGWSQSHDSLVPYPNSWCIEEELLPHYYQALPDIGSQLLNDSGLFPYGADGWRTYKGQPIHSIGIECGYSTDEIGRGIAQIGVDALLALGIKARIAWSDYNEYIRRLEFHGAYDMAFRATNFDSYDVDWLAYDYWSEYADVPYQNPANFRNETYDACRQQLLHGNTYEEVYNASAWMQRILHEQVPRLVVYENYHIQEYRTNQFVGHVKDLGGYISGMWTMRKIHRLDGSAGGVTPIAISEDPDSFNIFTAESSPSEIIFDELYSSLYRYGPDLKPYPDLASSLLIESHADNSGVPDGHIRFTMDMVQNATWSDGVPLTAEDVTFTIAYAFESSVFGNPAITGLGDLVGAYAPNSYRVVFEYASESYWHFSKFAYVRIIPKHIFTPDGGIDYDGWAEWNPVFDSEAPHVTCGPFLLAGYEPGEWYNLTWNPLFHYRVDVSLHEPQRPANSTSSSTITTSGVNGWSDTTLFITSTISTGSAAVIVFSIYGIFRHKRSQSA